MEDFFSLFYRNNLYGEQLYYHLRGWDDASGGFVASADKFPTIFLVTFGTALLMFLAYYYIFNHPRWNRWYHWLLPLFVSIGVGFGLAYGIVTTDLSAGVIADSLAPYVGPGNASCSVFTMASLADYGSSFFHSFYAPGARTASIPRGRFWQPS